MMNVSWVKTVVRQVSRTFLNCNVLMGILRIVRKEPLGEASGVLALLIASVLAALRRIKIESILNLKPAQNRKRVLRAKHSQNI